jgi:hypothetical protein
MEKLNQIFTPERRQQIQLFLGTLAPLLILGGFATQAQTEQGLFIAGAVIQFLAAVLSLVNVRKGDWGAGWAVLRAAIYALAATVSPALVFFGLYSDDVNTSLLTGISLGLTSLSTLLAIFIGKNEQLEKVEKLAKAQGAIIPKTDAGKDRALAEFVPDQVQGRD